MSEPATTVQPRTVVIERRWAIIGASVTAALILILSVALAFSLGDDGGRPDGPPGMQFSQGGFAPGVPEGGAQQMPVPQGAPPMPQAPGGDTYGQAVPAPPGAGQAPQSGQGSGGNSNQ